MMMNAEPNILINRQQSLAQRRQSSGKQQASLKARGSGQSSTSSHSNGSSSGGFEKALTQGATLRPELRCSTGNLAARHAGIPQVLSTSLGHQVGNFCSGLEPR